MNNFTGYLLIAEVYLLVSVFFDSSFRYTINVKQIKIKKAKGRIFVLLTSISSFIGLPNVIVVLKASLIPSKKRLTAKRTAKVAISVINGAIK